MKGRNVKVEPLKEALRWRTKAGELVPPVDPTFAAIEGSHDAHSRRRR